MAGNAIVVVLFVIVIGALIAGAFTVLYSLMMLLGALLAALGAALAVAFHWVVEHSALLAASALCVGGIALVAENMEKRRPSAFFLLNPDEMAPIPYRVGATLLLLPSLVVLVVRPGAQLLQLLCIAVVSIVVAGWVCYLTYVGGVTLVELFSEAEWFRQVVKAVLIAAGVIAVLAIWWKVTSPPQRAS